MSERGTDDASSPPRVVRKKGISEDDSWWYTRQNTYLSQADVESSPLFSASTQSSPGTMSKRGTDDASSPPRNDVLPPPNNTMSKRGTGWQQAFTPPTGPIPPGPSGTTDSNNNPLALGGNVDQHDNHDTVSDQADNASSSPSHQINVHDMPNCGYSAAEMAITGATSIRRPFHERPGVIKRDRKRPPPTPKTSKSKKKYPTKRANLKKDDIDDEEPGDVGATTTTDNGDVITTVEPMNDVSPQSLIDTQVVGSAALEDDWSNRIVFALPEWSSSSLLDEFGHSGRYYGTRREYDAALQDGIEALIKRDQDVANICASLLRDKDGIVVDSHPNFKNCANVRDSGGRCIGDGRALWFDSSRRRRCLY